ncbi:MAG: FAD:protein FMN transferase [Minisyncoccia bacterium]
MSQFEFQAIGTTWKIDMDKKLSPVKEGSLLQKILERISKFNLVYSRFQDNTLVTKMSRKAGSYTLPDDADIMITLYKKIYDVTDGSVTPLIGQVLVDAGYDANYSLVQKSLTKPKKWEEVIIWENPTLTLQEPTLLDFGAGGKGYLVDIVSKILESEGIESYCVDAGGDMRVRGQELRVGLENPTDTTSVIGITNLKNQSLCGSAGNRRAWGNFHHIINPETLTSPRKILAVWVVAKTTILADLMTTGLFFVSPQTLLQHFDFEYLILCPDFSIEKSKGFEVELFT